MLKISHPIKLAGIYAENPQRNRDRVKAKVNWYKTKSGRRDDWERR